MYFFHSTKWILIITRIWYETNRVLTIGTRYDEIKKLESSASATELAKVHDVGEATVPDIKKWSCNTENYLKVADSSVSARVEKS